MGFAVDFGEEQLYERDIKGHRQKVAVDCWFTSTGRTMPRLVKYEDAEGKLQALRDIRIMRQDQKNYAGIYCRRFDCKTVVDGREQDFTLLFYPKEHIWDMVLPD